VSAHRLRSACERARRPPRIPPTVPHGIGAAPRNLVGRSYVSTIVLYGQRYIVECHACRYRRGALISCRNHYSSGSSSVTRSVKEIEDGDVTWGTHAGTSSVGAVPLPCRGVRRTARPGALPSPPSSPPSRARRAAAPAPVHQEVPACRASIPPLSPSRVLSAASLLAPFPATTTTDVEKYRTWTAATCTCTVHQGSRYSKTSGAEADSPPTCVSPATSNAASSTDARRTRHASTQSGLTTHAPLSTRRSGQHPVLTYR